jgi:hypothetical protein
MPVVLPSLEHVETLSDDVGIIQHATESIPNRSTGYCTDDVSRAFMVALDYDRLMPHHDAALKLAARYLSFLYDAQLDDGRFHNFMSYERVWTDDVGTHDSNGRAMWALGFGVRYAPTESWRRASRTMLDRALQNVEWLEFPRSQAYAMLGLAHALTAESSESDRLALRYLADRSLARYSECDATWPWFEPILTYDNARLPEALLRAGLSLGDDACTRTGLLSLDFLESIVFEGDTFVPIGSNGWYPRGGNRAIFAQQPLEAAAMIDAELAAYEAVEQPSRLAAAQRCYLWYEGKNTLKIPLSNGGGCFDGLESSGPNRNMGAESTLARLAGAIALAQIPQARQKSRAWRSTAG